MRESIKNTSSAQIELIVMVNFKEFGFVTLEEYLDSFMQSLLPSNKTYDYFVDWKKVKATVEKYVDEISLLNSLTRIENKREHLRVLLRKYPSVIEVIPLLIAERIKSGKIEIFDIDLEDFVSFDFQSKDLDENKISKAITFCEKTGLLTLFNEINDLSDYLTGVEVGLDTNARKNRSGDIFEKMCQQKMKKNLPDDYRMESNDTKFSLYQVLTKGASRGKTHDIVVYKKGNIIPQVVAECNFYNVSGSKPISIAESYVEMNRAAKEKGIKFLWITDGPAWKNMKEPLTRCATEIEYLFNFKMLTPQNISKILE